MSADKLHRPNPAPLHAPPKRGLPSELRAPPRHTRTIRKVKQGGIWAGLAAAAVAAAEFIQPGTVAFLGPLAPLAAVALQFGVSYFAKSDPNDFTTPTTQPSSTMDKAQQNQSVTDIIEEIFDDEGDKQIAIDKLNALIDIPGLSEEAEEQILTTAVDALLFVYHTATK